jgi:radical SAM superfamily enzyme YgiQ (UPF0313 family)
MKILLVYPKVPETFWSFKYALTLISKKAAFPPLGLLQVASMLPEYWEKKLVDLNVEKLNANDIKWADYVFISAMEIQRKSTCEIIKKCKELNIKTVGGGPLFKSFTEDFSELDHVILNEAEITLKDFLFDLDKNQTKKIYSSNKWADMKTCSPPMWNLIDTKKYASLSIQYSRGCPYDCEFCDVIQLFGKKPRLKNSDQIIFELEEIYKLNWKGNVFFVDDNFIGNKTILKTDLLPKIINLMEKKNYPFSFYTEASINISDDNELMNLMVKAGFDKVFIGIESPNEASLSECNKYQNENRDILDSVKICHSKGLQVQGGFIVGFDSDPTTIFNNISDFINNSKIVTAMVGLLNAPVGTKLYDRLMKEGRITENMSGDNTDFSMNFIPKMDYNVLIDGYKNILRSIYSPKYYYKRVTDFLKDYSVNKQKFKFKFKSTDVITFIKTTLTLGILGKERFYYWKLVFWTLIKKPKLFSKAIEFSIYGFHFRKLFDI